MKMKFDDLDDVQAAAANVLIEVDNPMQAALAAVRELEGSPVQHAVFLNTCDCENPNCKAARSGMIAITDERLLDVVLGLLETWDEMSLIIAAANAAAAAEKQKGQGGLDA